MDFLKTLLVYLTVTMATGVQQGPPVADVPVPTATPYVAQQAQETNGLQVELPETPAPATATPNPNPTITPNRSYKNIAYGDSGNAVKKLQRKLIELGYLPEKADDGKFGYQTLNAVRAFQEKNGLSKDGVAGAATLTHLYEDPDVVPAATPTIAPTDTPEPTDVPQTQPSTAEPEQISAPEAIAPPEGEEPEVPAPETPAEPAKPAEPAAEGELVEGPLPGLQQVMGATIALGESGSPLASLRLSDGVMVPFYPRVWLNEEDAAVVSLRDMADSISSWTLEIDEDDDNAYTLTAAGYVISVTVTDGAAACEVDGASVALAATDIQSDGVDLYVTEDFLREAMKASVLWDADEHTLMLTVPEKEAAQAKD